jgi:hypothetical protein
MFRFSIRELLLLTLVFALVAGWWIDRRTLLGRVAESAVWKQRAEAIQQMAPYADCQVSWDEGSVSFVFPGGSSQRATSAGGLRPVD